MDEIQLRLLKEELKICYLIIVIALCLAGVINFAYALGNFADSDLWYVLVLNLAVFALISVSLYFFNKDIYRDIKHKEILEVRTVVLDKNERLDYEPGSGALSIPVLGNLFSELWGQKMKEVYTYEIITEEKKAEVNKEMFESLHLGDEVVFSYAKYSKTFLGIKKG